MWRTARASRGGAVPDPTIRAELGIDAEMRTILITDQAPAERARFPGSLTVRVAGRDVEHGAEPPIEYTWSVACTGMSIGLPAIRRSTGYAMPWQAAGRT